MTAESASASCCQIIWKYEKENSILSFSKTFYFDTLCVYFDLNSGPFLLELISVYVADGINNPDNIQSDGVRIQSFFMALIEFYCCEWLMVYSFIIPRVWECWQYCQPQCHLAWEQCLVSHQITSISRPGNISLKYLDIWSQLECMAYQPLHRKKHPLIRRIWAQVHITFLGGIEKQYHSHLMKLNRNTLTELNRVISTGLFIKMLKIVFNWNIFLSVWGVQMIVTRKIYFAFNNKMFRSALQ